MSSLGFFLLGSSLGLYTPVTLDTKDISSNSSKHRRIDSCLQIALDPCSEPHRGPAGQMRIYVSTPVKQTNKRSRNTDLESTCICYCPYLGGTRGSEAAFGTEKCWSSRISGSPIASEFFNRTSCSSALFCIALDTKLRSSTFLFWISRAHWIDRER